MKWTLSTVFILVSIFFVALNMRPAVTAIGPLFNVLMDSLQVTNMQMSLLTSIPVFCMGLFAPFAVPMQKKIGTKKAISVLVLLIVLANGARFLKESYFLLVCTSFLVGLAIAIIGPLMNAFIKERFPQHVASVIGLYSFGIGTGATLSAGFTVTMYQQTDANWAFALGSWSILAAIAVVIWVIAVPNDEVITDATQVKVNENARNPWRHKKAWLILLFFGLQTSLFFSIMAWLTPMLQDKGLSLVSASTVLTVLSIVQMVGNIAIPLLMEKWQSRISWLFSLSVLGIIGFVLLWIGTGAIIWLAVLIIGVVLSGMFPIALMLPLDESRTAEEASSWSSMVLSGGFMMSAIIPLLIGYCYDITANHHFTYAIFIALIIAILGTTVALKKQT
ncbi:MAG: MFS transporter [Lysinibacillus sp.]